MASEFKCLSFLCITTIFIAMNQISCAQSSQTNSSYIVTISGDTIRNCEIKKNHKLTNEDQVTYIYNNTRNSLPSNSIKSFFNGSELFVSELLKHEIKYKLISYLIGGTSSFGQAFSRKGKAIFYLKRSDTQEVVCLEDHKLNLLPFVQSFLPDFDAFYKTYNAKVYYEYKSIAELISAYNAFKEPSIYVPTKYKYRENIKFGMNASIGIGNLAFTNSQSDLNSLDNFSFGLNFKQFYTRNINFNFSISYNNSSFKGTNEDVYIKSISVNPNLGFSKALNSKLDITLKGGLSLSYNIDSYLAQKTEEGVVLVITGFNLGPQVSVEFTYLKKYGFFTSYLTYTIKTKEGGRFLTIEAIKANTQILRFGFLYYFN